MVPPFTLVLCIKRFNFDAIAAEIQTKETRDVGISLELDLTPYMFGYGYDDRVAGVHLYRLTAVVVHLGDSVRRGHYETYALGSSGDWCVECLLAILTTPACSSWGH